MIYGYLFIKSDNNFYFFRITGKRLPKYLEQPQVSLTYKDNAIRDAYNAVQSFAGGGFKPWNDKSFKLGLKT